MPDGDGFAKQCLQIAFAPAIMDARLSWMPGYHGCIVGHSSERRSRMSHYLLASGDLLVIAAIILSVAYLSWKQFSK